MQYAKRKARVFGQNPTSGFYCGGDVRYVWQTLVREVFDCLVVEETEIKFAFVESF